MHRTERGGRRDERENRSNLGRATLFQRKQMEYGVTAAAGNPGKDLHILSESPGQNTVIYFEKIP